MRNESLKIGNTNIFYWDIKHPWAFRYEDDLLYQKYRIIDDGEFILLVINKETGLVAAFKIDDKEFDFNFDRPIRFADMEGIGHILADPAVIKADYQRELDRYLATMEHGCREFGVDYHRVFTDMDYEAAIAAFLLKRMKKQRMAGG